MNSRQRLFTAFSHKQPDRCPTYIWIDDDAMKKLIEYLNVKSAEEAKEVLRIDKWQEIGLDISLPNEVLERINSFVPSEYKNNPEFYIMDSGRVVRIHEDSGYLEDTVWNPLGEIDKIENLDTYPFPQEDWIKTPVDLKSRIEEYKEIDYVVVSSEIPQLFKSAWLLRGMQNVLMDYLINPDLINEMYEKIFSFEMAKCVHLVRAGVDAIQIVGDLGMQNGLIMSPDTWREFDKWRLKKLIQNLKGINPELKMYMHTDGDVHEIIEDLIEVGIDILNPIQPECMEPIEIKRKHGDKLVLHGAVSLQKTLPFASPDEVKAEVKYLIENCNVNGGFVVGPSNALFKEIPPENIVAMYEAVY